MPYPKIVKKAVTVAAATTSFNDVIANEPFATVPAGKVRHLRAVGVHSNDTNKADITWELYIDDQKIVDTSTITTSDPDTLDINKQVPVDVVLEGGQRIRLNIMNSNSTDAVTATYVLIMDDYTPEEVAGLLE